MIDPSLLAYNLNPQIAAWGESIHSLSFSLPVLKRFFSSSFRSRNPSLRVRSVWKCGWIGRIRIFNRKAETALFKWFVLSLIPSSEYPLTVCIHSDDKDEDYSPNITRQSSRSSTKSSSPPQTPAASFQVQIALLVLSQLSGLPSGHYNIDWSIVGVELVGHSQTARQLQANWKNWKQELHQIGSYVDLKWTHQEDDALRLAVEEIGPTGEDDHYKVDNGDENVAKWLLVRDRLGEKDQACLENIVKRWKYLSGREPSKGIEESGLYSMDLEQISTGGQFLVSS